MSWVMISVLAYLVICWVSSWILVCWGTACREGCDGDNDVRPAEVKQKWPLRYFLAMAAVTIFLGPFLPALLAYTYFAERQARRQWIAFSRTYRAPSYDELHPANLPAMLQELSERLTNQYSNLRFQSVGCFFVKPEPLEIHSELLISADGSIVGDISQVGEVQSYSFTSVLENGEVLETACFESENDPSDSPGRDRFHADIVDWNLASDCVAQLHERHSQSLRELQKEKQCGVCQFDPSQAIDVMTYADRVMATGRFQAGEMNEPPPEPELPTARSVRPDPEQRVTQGER